MYCLIKVYEGGQAWIDRGKWSGMLS